LLLVNVVVCYLHWLHIEVFVFIHIESNERSSSLSFFAAGKPNIDPLPPGGSLGKTKGRNLWITIPHSGSVDHLNDENNHSKLMKYIEGKNTKI
jgi:hypothetical protein